MKRLLFTLSATLALAATAGTAAAETKKGGPTAPLAERLKALPYKIAWECYVDDSFEIFVMNADGSQPVNLTRTPKVHEHYPQVSPDGTKICFTVDTGAGRETVRSLWVMDIDGKHRRQIAARAREPFWAPDGKTIGYLGPEYPRFDALECATKGMFYYHLDSGRSEPHPNSANLLHLFNPSFAANGKWIAATVMGALGFGQAIVLIEAHGRRVIDLKIPGCRPCLSPDGRHIAWGASDHELATAPIDLDAETPAVGPWSVRIGDAVNDVYHIDKYFPLDFDPLRK
jgi:hypothetical protein